MLFPVLIFAAGIVILYWALNQLGWLPKQQEPTQ